MMLRQGRYLTRSFSRLNLKGPHPKLADFIAQTKLKDTQPLSSGVSAHKVDKGLKIYIETYGCQMNLSDSEIVRSILGESGHAMCQSEMEADVILTNTCAIRENAESKVWDRLVYFQSIRKKNRSKGVRLYPIVGVLGCMAERLKDKLLLEESVDFVCGPDAYRDMPRLLENIVSVGQKEANTVLSFEETYADINPVREVNNCSAFVSIMRGCNNMCSFCIVPFTRGRERSRPMSSIIKEVEALSASGVKEIVLLGQNVNGYHDNSTESAESYPTTTYKATPGFSNLYQSKKRDVPGARFSDLLSVLADINPEMRIRFTSPHPKDFPEDVLSIINSKRNICASLHLPVQSGSSAVLQKMRRGYTREAYLALVRRCREMIPGVAISTDIITGFCGETEEDHQETLSLMREVRFDQAFMYAYSMREKTHANRTMEDDVPHDVKQRRLREIIANFRDILLPKNDEEEHGQLRLVLVEEFSDKSTPEKPLMTGRTDGNKRIIFPGTPVLKFRPGFALELAKNNTKDIKVVADIGDKKSVSLSVSDLLFDHKQAASLAESEWTPYLETGLQFASDSECFQTKESPVELVQANELIGQYVLVRVLRSFTSTLKGYAVALSSMKENQDLEEHLKFDSRLYTKAASQR